MRRPPALAPLLAALACAGCGGAEGAEAPEPPTRAELARFAAETRQPAYWLGPDFRGIAVSHARAEGGRADLTYGRWTCDSGCTPSGGVGTGPRDLEALAIPDFGRGRIDPEDCWSRVGRAVAVLIGCEPAGYPQDLVVYSGGREIRVTSLYTPDGQGEIPVRTVVRGLRPLNARAPWPLQRPTRLTCRELRRVDRRYRRGMPAALRPRSAC